ncbi:ras-domain-containing protein [Lentinula boryana]|uniref:Ras-domain-containing protein n=1 Tax=Lentinula boryana TaxID=40481 RepID=A0ABQ8Q8F6_9AGAR|nr:ras-domain-containing protein [Lentinula boryana]
MTVPQRTIKLVVIGASGVGKTSMRGQYISQRFSTGYRATIGADFITKVVQVGEEMVTLQIWDTAGQERFSSLSSAFFRGADAALLVFDVNTPDSLHALKKWWEEFKVHAPLEDDELGSFCCVVVGNKLDLGEGKARTFMDTLVPPELYRDREEDSDEEDDPLSASQMTATPIRMHSKPTHQLLSPSSSISTSHPRPRSRSKSTEPRLTRSIYASSSVSGLSLYHTPSSSVYNHYDSARSSPDLNFVPFLSTSPHLHSHPRSHLGLEIDPDSPIPSSQSESRIPQTPDTGYRLFFASAKTGEGVNDVFEYVARRVVGQWDWESKQAQRRREAEQQRDFWDVSMYNFIPASTTSPAII